MNALEKCFDMFITIAILFLIPLLFYSGSSEILCSVAAGAACENFLKRVSTTGEITLPVWKELENSLERFGCEEFLVRREFTLWEPATEIGSVSEQRYSMEKDDLLDQIYAEGVVGMHKGDRLQVTVYIDDCLAVYYGVIRSEGKIE